MFERLRTFKDLSFMRRFENIEGMLKEKKMLVRFGSQSKGISRLYIPTQRWMLRGLNL